MTAYIALLRGVNVGRKQVKMDALKGVVAGLGHADATTYVQSGNVVFTGRRQSPARVASAIEAALAKELGLDAAVLVRTEDEMAKVVEANPLLGGGRDPAKLHVTLLAESPAATRVADLSAPPVGSDEFEICRREVYLYCPDGYGRTKLHNAFWEKRLAVTATTRNWKTVNRLLAMAAELK